MSTDNAKAKKAFRTMRKMKGTDRIDRRAAYMRSLPYEIQWRVARLAAGGTLKGE